MLKYKGRDLTLTSTVCPKLRCQNATTPTHPNGKGSVLAADGTARILLQLQTDKKDILLLSFMLLSVHGSHIWLIMDGLGRGESCTYDQLVPVLRPIKLERPSATARTTILRKWGPRQCEATCCFNSCAEQSHKDV